MSQQCHHTKASQPILPGFRATLGLRSAQPLAQLDGAAIVVHIPGIVLRSLNQTFRGTTRGARMVSAAKAKKQRADVTLALRSACRISPALPLVVTVTRVAPGRLDEHDNLPAACKHVVDAIAEFCGADDRDPRWTWRYAQTRDGKNYGVTIRIESGRIG